MIHDVSYLIIKLMLAVDEEPESGDSPQTKQFENVRKTRINLLIVLVIVLE